MDDILNIEIAEELLNESIELCDFCGRAVFQSQLLNTINQIDLTNLAPGSYCLRIRNQNKLFKIIKS